MNICIVIAACVGFVLAGWLAWTSKKSIDLAREANDGWEKANALNQEYQLICQRQYIKWRYEYHPRMVPFTNPRSIMGRK